MSPGSPQMSCGGCNPGLLGHALKFLLAPHNLQNTVLATNRSPWLATDSEMNRTPSGKLYKGLPDLGEAMQIRKISQHPKIRISGLAAWGSH